MRKALGLAVALAVAVLVVPVYNYADSGDATQKKKFDPAQKIQINKDALRQTALTGCLDSEPNHTSRYTITAMAQGDMNKKAFFSFGWESYNVTYTVDAPWEPRVDGTVTTYPASRADLQLNNLEDLQKLKGNFSITNNGWRYACPDHATFVYQVKNINTLGFLPRKIITIPLSRGADTGVTACSYNFEMDQERLTGIFEQISTDERSGYRDIVIKGQLCASRDSDFWQQRFNLLIWSREIHRWVPVPVESDEDLIGISFTGARPDQWEGFVSTP